MSRGLYKCRIPEEKKKGQIDILGGGGGGARGRPKIVVSRTVKACGDKIWGRQFRDCCNLKTKKKPSQMGREQGFVFVGNRFLGRG